MANISFDGFKNDEADNNLSLIKNNPAQLDPMLAQQDMGLIVRAGQAGMYGASDAVKPFADAKEACLDTMGKMCDSFTGVINTYIQAKASVISAQISADAAVEQSYNNLLSVRAQCEKEIEIAKMELEKFQKKYDMCMKVLNDAQGNFEMQLEALGIILKNLMEGKEKIWKMIDDDKELKNADTYFSQLNASNASILELSKQIADLKPVYNSLPEIN